MAAVGLSREQALELISGTAGAVSIAAVDGPASTVLAGDRAVLAALEDKVQAGGAFWAIVQEECAFHSPAMDGGRRNARPRARRP